MIRTSTIVLSVWGDVGKYKWGPKANPYTPDLRTPDCAKGCSAFFAHVNSRRPKVIRGDTTIIPTAMRASREGATALKLQSQGLNPG